MDTAWLLADIAVSGSRARAKARERDETKWNCACTSYNRKIDRAKAREFGRNSRTGHVGAKSSRARANAVLTHLCFMATG